MEHPLYWNRCRGDVWADLGAVNVGHRHFDGLEGVYVIWHGGEQARTLRVGQGLIRDRILFHRRDPQVLAYKDRILHVSWARTDKNLRDGVERFLAETLRPEIQSPLPNAPPVEVNLVGRPPANGAKLVSELQQPEQIWEDIIVRAGEAPSDLRVHDVQIVEPPQAVPPPAAPVFSAPKVKRITRLQSRYNELLEKMKPKVQRGFFGGGGGPKTPEEETLVIHTAQIILEEAARMQASDVHIEPHEAGVRVRLRIDGILEEALDIPRTMNIRVVSRIRVQCGLDPEQEMSTGRPQDGRMAMTVDGRKLDLRLSTFPTSYGDKAALRVIPHEARVPRIEELGLNPRALEKVLELIHLPQGMIVLTGPAGSGKSTTLYTVLQRLNNPFRNIVTLEDPVEQNIKGITQGALQPKSGFTFAEGLRAILRQDPNVIMVGEIRDQETSEIAMSAALTGHLLLTTLHTNNALGAVVRLLDMGLEPFLISSTLTAVFAQRLARRICDKCREAYKPTAAECAEAAALAKRSGVGFSAERFPKLYRGLGCDACRDTGFHGRILLFELVQISAALRKCILRKDPLDEMRRTAIDEGMETLWMDGIAKAGRGLTTLGELVRVAGVVG